jgi:hypothetical protein
MKRLDQETIYLLCGVIGVLIAGSIAGFVASRQVRSDTAKATVAGVNARLR